MCTKVLNNLLCRIQHFWTSECVQVSELIELLEKAKVFSANHRDNWLKWWYEQSSGWIRSLYCHSWCSSGCLFPCNNSIHWEIVSWDTTLLAEISGQLTSCATFPADFFSAASLQHSETTPQYLLSPHGGNIKIVESYSLILVEKLVSLSIFPVFWKSSSNAFTNSGFEEKLKC